MKGIALGWVWVCMLLLVVGCEGCLEQERSALLQLKQHFFYSSYRLRHWVAVDNLDCCRWGAVWCDPSTGRVTYLDLGYMFDDDQESEDQRYLNVSLFSPFKELQYLRLVGNSISGWVENEGPEKLSGLRNLEILELSGNKFKNSNFSSLAALPSLKGLYLSDNGLKDIEGLNHLTRLEVLDLSGNNFSSLSALPSSLKTLYLYDNGLKDIEGLNHLTRLEVLDLSGNHFNSSIFSSLAKAGLSSLKGLSLADIGLKGSVDIQELCSLSNLERLDMSGNEIDNFVFQEDKTTGFKKLRFLRLWNISSNSSNTDGGRLLQSLGPLPSLKSLDLSLNNFSGEQTTNQALHSLTNLEELLLDDSFIHTSLLQTIGTLTSLKTLFMPYCQINGNILTDHHQGLCELVNLQELNMIYSDLRGTLPSCFANLTSLRILDISFNHFTGDIASSPLKSLTSLQHLRLSYNHFKIPISLEPFLNHSNLTSINGDGNEIYADEIESHSSISKFQLKSLRLSGYGDGGTFPKFLYHQRDLQEIDLSHSQLTGEFPNWLLRNNTQLHSLLLPNNSLSGAFKLPTHSHMHLTKLDISANNIQGHIPKEIGAYMSKLEWLNVSTNDLIGSIPLSFGDMKSLQTLDLSNNHLSGEIPQHLAMGCFSLQELVLSNNSLQGQIFSSNFNLTNLSRLQLDGNNFSGNIPDSLSTSSFLKGLYLSDNHLSGGIPRWLGNMSLLEDIIMPNNHLEGPIPTEFCQLESLQVLDLSNNSVSGKLPSCFSHLSIRKAHLSRNKLQGQVKDAFRNSSSLETLDLGYNYFTGSIPDWIGNLSLLSYLILTNNNFEGEMPIQLCQLDQLRLINLSHNNLTGHIHPCLNVTLVSASSYLPTNYNSTSMKREEIVEFTTKSISYSYQGKILTYMSGIDLSRNKLTGEIPPQIGNLIGIHTLNLSHNNLTGPIPSTFSYLNEIESLDLSYNNLNGKLPPQLLELHYLGFFSVAHNNLSGETLGMSGQSITFGEGSYVGNPLLCGFPLPKRCGATGSKPSLMLGDEEDDDFIDMDIFYISFVVSYMIVLLGIAIVLYINPYWRRRWFVLVETWMSSCYYFVVDHIIPKRLYQANI